MKCHPASPKLLSRFFISAHLWGQTGEKSELSPTRFLGSFGQRFEKIISVHLAQKNVVPLVLPAHDVIRGIRILNVQMLLDCEMEKRRVASITQNNVKAMPFKTRPKP